MAWPMPPTVSACHAFNDLPVERITSSPRAVRCPAILGTVCAYIILIPGLAFNFIHCCQFLTECGKRDSFFDELRTFLSSQAQKGACAFCV